MKMIIPNHTPAGTFLALTIAFFLIAPSQAETNKNGITDEQLKMQARRMTENILRDIRDLVDAKAKAGGYTLVIDIAAKSAVGTPIVLYTNGQNDMTQEVLLQLNSTAPVGLLKSDDAKDQTEDKKEDKKGDNK